jgi:hypothetical protein
VRVLQITTVCSYPDSSKTRNGKKNHTVAYYKAYGRLGTIRVVGDSLFKFENRSCLFALLSQLPDLVKQDIIARRGLQLQSLILEKNWKGVVAYLVKP